MKRILVVADAAGETQNTIRRAVALGAKLDARLDIVGFVYENISTLPADFALAKITKMQKTVASNHARALRDATTKAVKNRKIKTKIEVHWEKRISDWITNRLKEQDYDLVIKGRHGGESSIYTPTDWQLLRGSKAPVLLFAEKRWKNGTHVLAAVDLGTKSRSKKKLNNKIVEHGWAMAKALGSKLHIAYAIPISPILRDLDVLDRHSMRKEGKERAEKFCSELASKGIAIEGVHVVTGPPEKVLVSLAAKHHARLVVLGTIGRKKFVGRIIGNTAEKILRLMKADVLAIKP